MLLKKALLCLGVALMLPAAALPDGKAGEGSVGFRLSYYDSPDDDGSAGNPFLDESLTVVEPVLFFTYNLTDDRQIWGKLSYDYVSSASIDRLSRYPEQSGASGDYYIGAEGGIKLTLADDRRVGFSGQFSTEYDYKSVGIGADYEVDVQPGTTVRLGLNTFIDLIDVIRFDGKEDVTDTRLTLTASAGLYQAYSSTLHGDYGAVLTIQQGFLETAYNSVVIEDGSGPNPALVGNAPGREVTEELPDTRIRGSVYGKLKKQMTESGAGEIGSRLYADSWGIVGLTLEPRWYQWIIDERLLMRLRYRFYTQTAADAYSERFTMEKSERTQDADLGAFNAHTFGVKFILNTSERSEWDAGIDYTLRDDDLNYWMTSIGYRRSF